MSMLIRTELQKFITGLGKSGQLSIRKAGSEALFFFVLRYLLCAAGEIRQALSIGDIGPASLWKRWDAYWRFFTF